LPNWKLLCKIVSMSVIGIGSRIASLREARGIKGEQLGLALGLSKSQVSKIENGARKLDVSEVALVADALGVTLAEVLGIERRGSLVLAARVMAPPDAEAALTSRHRIRQILEVDAALTESMGLRGAEASLAGKVALARTGSEELASMRSTNQAGARLASIVREELGLGRAPISDVAELAEQHFGVDVLNWPTGPSVSGLCVHGDGVAMMLVSTSFSIGHQRFTAAHELAHHLLSDPRSVVVEEDIYDQSNPMELRANAFAATFLMPEEGVREVVKDRQIDEVVLAQLMRHFGVSYKALINRLRNISLMSRSAAETWAARTPTSVLRDANDSNPEGLTLPTEERRIPPRLWRAAEKGYKEGRVGLGTLATLSDEDSEILFNRLAKNGVYPPSPVDDLSDV
jgi:Zn-dependent peptidase ImmA (M78 family)/transcriptional regulator with XRE-family HTH domain